MSGFWYSEDTPRYGGEQEPNEYRGVRGSGFKGFRREETGSIAVSD